MAEGVVGAEIGQTISNRCRPVELGDQPFAERLSQCGTMALSLGEFTQLIWPEERFDFSLVVVGPRAGGASPRFSATFALTDVL